MNNRDVIYAKVSSSGGRQSIERQVADLTTYAAVAGALMRHLRKCVEKSSVNYLKSKDFLVVHRIININNLFSSHYLMRNLFLCLFIMCSSAMYVSFAQNSFVNPSRYAAIASMGYDLDDFDQYGYDDRFKDDKGYNIKYEIYKVLCNKNLSMAERGKGLIKHLNFHNNVFNYGIYSDDGYNFIEFGSVANSKVKVSWSLDTNGDEELISSIIGSGSINGSKYWILSHPDSFFPIIVGDASLLGKETKGCDYFVFIPRSNIVFLYMIAKTYSQTSFIDGHEYVDLGLPSGLLWATANVGYLNKYGEIGYNFAWAETKEKNIYERYTLKYCINGEKDNYSKYNRGKVGTKDGRTTLEPMDDAASVNWGAPWRTPTKAECQELIDNCNYEWTTINFGGFVGTRTGGLFTSRINGKSIFFPATGHLCNQKTGSIGVDQYGLYWSASIYDMYEGQSDDAWTLHIRSKDAEMGISTWGRRLGQSVRPVAKK